MADDIEVLKSHPAKGEQMLIFVICPVRNATPEQTAEIVAHVQRLESEGHIVHWPARDTDQTQSGYDICLQNLGEIEMADEVHVFYEALSQGVHFDLGAAFSLDKHIVVIRNGQMTEGKSFPRMLKEWEQASHSEYWTNPYE